MHSTQNGTTPSVRGQNNAAVNYACVLTSRLAVVELIAATTTTAGLEVECELDTGAYQKGIRVTDAEMKLIELRGDAFHPEWNYTISPRPEQCRS